MLHPAQAATIFIEGRNIGYVGTVHPKWAMAEKLRVPVVVAIPETVASTVVPAITPLAKAMAPVVARVAEMEQGMGLQLEVDWVAGL